MMIYLKSIGVGLPFVLGALYATLLLGGVALGFASRLRGQREEGFWISVHSPYFWLPCLLVFIAGFVRAHRRFSQHE